MKIENANLSPLNGTSHAGRNQATGARPNEAGDDIHLSELVRSLRSLVPDSPERQERLEQIARAYADGTYEVDAEATAGKMIDETIRYR
jgi:flagellar biosynthesis anti-sigma factor FlgM